MLLEYFQMIDQISSVDRDRELLVAQSRVPESSPVFEGHFPGMPLVPGVLLIETMAQACGFLVLANSGFAAMPFLVGVKRGKLRTFVEPAAVLDVEARLEHMGSGYAVAKGAILSSGTKISDAQLTFKTMDFPDQTFTDMIVKRAAEVGMPQELLP